MSWWNSANKRVSNKDRLKQNDLLEKYLVDSQRILYSGPNAGLSCIYKQKLLNC